MEKASWRVRAAQFNSLTGLHDVLLSVSSAVHHFRSADGVYFTWRERKFSFSFHFIYLYSSIHTGTCPLDMGFVNKLDERIT